jgi:hypothetical protein
MRSESYRLCGRRPRLSLPFGLNQLYLKLAFRQKFFQ